VVDLGDFRTFVIADIPIDRGAHEGHGLGDRFLRHVERTKLLLHLVDVSSASGRDSVSDYEVINRELGAYDEQLGERAQFVVATKSTRSTIRRGSRDYVNAPSRMAGRFLLFPRLRERACASCSRQSRARLRKCART